jgi:hypothetical protein
MISFKKSSLIVKAPKTVDNALTVPKSSASFHDFEQYDRPVDTAREPGRQSELIVLLAGDAGIRCGEMIALE